MGKRQVQEDSMPGSARWSRLVGIRRQMYAHTSKDSIAWCVSDFSKTRQVPVGRSLRTCLVCRHGQAIVGNPSQA